MMEKNRYSTEVALVAEYETDGGMKFITGEDLELWYRDKIKEQYVPKKWNLMKALQAFSKVRTGEILMSLEVEGFCSRRFTEMQTGSRIRNKEVRNQFKSDVSKGSFEDMQTMAAIESAILYFRFIDW